MRTKEFIYDELLFSIKKLPTNYIIKLKNELDRIDILEENFKQKNNLSDFLLKGPIMNNAQYQEFLENREHLKLWRTN